MKASNLPEPWIIVELERQRRIQESQRDDRPSLELPLPPLPYWDPPKRGTGRTVIVVDLAGPSALH
jgi:hypothetical protein